MKIAVWMDPLHQIKPHKDSTLAMLDSAQQLGWSCFYFTLNDLFCREGRAFAQTYSIQINDVNQLNWCETAAIGECALADFDIILARQDPPFNMQYIYATYLLELAEKEGVLVANRPKSIRDANEKLFTLYFPQCCPKTIVSQNINRLKAFWDQHRDVIFKPLDGMGGTSVFHVDKTGQNLSVILEMLTQQQHVSIMAQVYIPEIKRSGDKRVILINGEPIPFGLARIPKAGETRGNLAAGGTGKVVEVTERDRWICAQIAPSLQAKGLYFVGIDIIGDYLTEINVTSPTCIREISESSGIDIARQYIEFLHHHINNRV